MLERVAYELGSGVAARLLLDVRAVRLDGPHAEEQLIADLGIRVSERDELEHLEFAVREIDRRSGRSVLYSQTSLAQSMIAIQEVARPGYVRALPGARMRR